MLEQDKSVEQQQSEVEYWRKQKELVEFTINQLNETKLTIFNFWKVYKIMKRLISVIGIGTATTLVQQADTWEAIMLLSKSNASLLKQIKHLHERLMGLEGK